MMSRPVLGYLIASSNARALDAQGSVPSLFMRCLVLIPAALLLAFVVGSILYVAVTMATGT